MTVVELIEKLKKMPQDKTISVYGDNDYSTIGGTSNIEVFQNNDGTIWIVGHEDWQQ